MPIFQKERIFFVCFYFNAIKKNLKIKKKVTFFLKFQIEMRLKLHGNYKVTFVILTLEHKYSFTIFFFFTLFYLILFE